MNIRRTAVGALAALGLVIGGFTALHAAQPRDINSGRHPNLAAAQRLVDQALNKISIAQQANEYDMNGHAARAKDLLEQANRELRAAAGTANHDRR